MPHQCSSELRVSSRRDIVVLQDGTPKLVPAARNGTVMARGLADFSPSQLRDHRMNVYARSDRVAMTAEELARAAGTTKAQILAYENGHRVPDPRRIQALAKALKVHPWALMNPEGRDDWSVADMRRACGLRAQDVVHTLGVSPKVYRRFETEGIVPSRRPQFLDEVAEAFDIPRKWLERAIDQTPAVKERRLHVTTLVKKLADRYVPATGPWNGPAGDDPDLLNLATAYGRPLARLRRVMTYELGELRHKHLRSLRERVIADYDTNRDRQASARYAAHRWDDILTRDLNRIPARLEAFHRNAQPSDVWELLVELYNCDAVARGEGLWAVASYLTDSTSALPPHLVEQHLLEGIPVCRLSTAGLSHVTRFAGLYAALYPATRRPKANRGSARKTPTPGTFVLPNHQIRLVIPQSFLDTLQLDVAPAKARLVDLHGRYLLTINPSSLAVTVLALRPDDTYIAKPVALFDLDDEILDAE
ncbi:helix-turn-helix transcriptional regulator [Streptomyces pilosus]|uniref:helix-turn-helix transcriptional regulator n=1 Tax=Streptomyces pilosus TaxID=28893 RepID=UPI003624D1D7